MLLQGLIFVVDSSDRERIEEASSELQTLVGVRAAQYGQYIICSMTAVCLAILIIHIANCSCVEEELHQFYVFKEILHN